MIRPLSVTLLTLLVPTAHADFGEYRSHFISEQTLVIESTIGTLNITAVDDSAFEVHYREDGVKQLPSFALASDLDTNKAVTVETNTTIDYAIDGLTARIEKSPLRVSFLQDGETLVSEEHGYYARETVRGFRFALGDDEKILGGGARVLGMDRRGKRMPLYNKAHYGYTTESQQMYFSLPAIMSSDKYMIVFDNSASGYLDIGHTESDVLSFEAAAGRTSYLVIAGADYPSLIENYTDVTGKQPLPPRWAFGNFASRFGYRSEKETRDVVDRFRKQNIPLDAIILDIFWFGPDIKGHMGNLDWDRDSFPTPEKMISDFRHQGVRTIAVTEPFILSTSKRWRDAVNFGALAKNVAGEPRRFDFYFGNTGLVDIFDDKAQDWFWQPYKMLFDQGAAATWGDLGEPEVHPGDSLHWLSDAGIEATGDEIHNAYGHVWAQMINEKQAQTYPDMRPLIMMRSGFAGSQRFGMIPWTGDVSREWDGLKPQIELSLQMGLFGLGYTHSDLGGFAGGVGFDREMYIRWLQYGVFQPVYRPHAQDHIAPEPVFHDRKTRKIVRDFIKLRYRLLPYNYTLAFENSTTGMPLMRPVFFEDENDSSLIDEKDSYLWGDAFFVAPVMDTDVAAVNVDLPDGVWFDFWNDHRYTGGQNVDISVDLETIPVLVRAGSIIPMTPDIMTTKDYSSKSLTLHYYADETVTRSTGKMYDDDGESRDSLEAGAFELLEFNASRSGDYLRLKLDHSGDGYKGMPEQRAVEVIIHNWSATSDLIRINGKVIKGKRKSDTLTIQFDWDHTPTSLEINTPSAPLVTGKPVLYQVFTRLFGNEVAVNKPWGTIEENGVGKFNSFSHTALKSIANLGVTHVWYTGVPHHALIRDYSEYGISDDDPDVVKGRAGSPYAVKDYYNVNPDLATDPGNRLAEFKALVERTHANDMKVIIDIVPNHVARRYKSISRPVGVKDFGADDDTTVIWDRDNNFYYVVGEDFSVPTDYVPLSSEDHPLADGEFEESPAKWTGNGSRSANPKVDDWFETVKINFGVRPDGSYAFDRLPDSARHWSPNEHLDFWRNRTVPDSWKKFRDIALFWSKLGVDGFRYDMAEMVPVEFWSYMNSSIKAGDPDAFLLAEIYNPSAYRDYIQLGLMDYLYDKVGMYDTIRQVTRGELPSSAIVAAQDNVADIESHMLHFLENHDEQRIASDPFAGNGHAGKPGMVISALLGRSPTMIYFAQELGERADGDPGFGNPTRTSIFDYWGMPSLQRWTNGGKFDGGKLTKSEKELRKFYASLLSFSATNPVMQGRYAEIHSHNMQSGSTYNERLFSFVRWNSDGKLVVVNNFDKSETDTLTLEIPERIIAEWRLMDGRYALNAQLYGGEDAELIVDHGVGKILLQLEPFQSLVLHVGESMFKSRDENPFIDDRQGTGVQGTLIHWKDTPSAFLTEPRHVVVWLPPGYAEHPEKQYRVIYMSDGENLFDPRIASWGIDWGIDEAINRGVQDERYEPAIVVGVWSSSRRGLEYSPWHDAPQYARFLSEELMPRVDAEFRTLKGPQNNFVMGSSMGGLLSFYLVKTRPDLFGACGCVSTHFALSESDFSSSSKISDATPYIIEDILDGQSVPSGVRFYFDYGTETLDSSYEKDHMPVRDWLLDQGLKEGQDFVMRKFPGADHSERAWRARVGDQIDWLLGAR